MTAPRYSGVVPRGHRYYAVVRVGNVFAAALLPPDYVFIPALERIRLVTRTLHALVLRVDPPQAAPGVRERGAA